MSDTENAEATSATLLAMNGWNAPAREKSKRVGRGIGSGKGKTCGRGHKGQRARSGGRRDGGFEGGQMPLTRRVPKRGFRSRLARRTAHIRLSDIHKLGEGGGDITIALLHEKGVLKNGITRARIYHSGDISTAVTIGGDIAVSAGAKAAIEKAGGSVKPMVIKPVVKKLPKKVKPAESAGTGDSAQTGAKPE